jgi:protein-disulfide isomerase
MDDCMKTSALPFVLFASLFAVGTIATSPLSGALAATAPVIPIEQQRLIVKDSGEANPDVTVVEYFDYNCPRLPQVGTEHSCSRQQ